MVESHILAKKKGWIAGEDYPLWGNNSLYLTTIQGGYLLPNETPKQAYQRLVQTALEYNKDLCDSEKDWDYFYFRFFEMLWEGWLIPSTPVMSNFGTDRGLPISCFSAHIGDDMYELVRKNAEMAILSKHGGGTALDYSAIRPIGSPIKNGLVGTSDGIIPFIKGNDSWILASKQGKMRRGAVAIYLNAEHKEYPQFLEIREPKGDVNRQCHNIHQGAIFTDEFMQKVVSHNGHERELWTETLKKRVKTGEPYVMYIDNANKVRPQFWQDQGLKIRHSNLCAEIMLPTDSNHTLVCCLSSLNLFKYDEWKDKNIPFYATLFLDAVISDFIEKGKSIQGIEDAVRFAEKSRALGLGALGWHSYLKSKMIPFVGIQANSLTKLIFGQIQKESIKASQHLAKVYGEPEWLKEQGYRNLTNIAIAPNRSSSKLAGGLSQGIEPDAAVGYMDDDAKGVHIRKDFQFEALLESKGKNTEAVWDEIFENKGSVQTLDFLTDKEKEVFRTFKEINQLELVKQAGIRQQYIDQGQSINLAFPQDAPAKFINKVHIEAWKLGLKSLYYFRSESILRADSKQQRDLYSECLMCEG